MATTTTYVPVEVYLRSSYEPDAEYVDGAIEERPTGEKDHVLWQKAILKWFWQYEADWHLQVLQEMRIQVAATRFRVPDVTVFDASQPDEQVVTHPPLAVFEVLAPEDRLQRRKVRLQDYHLMGIAEIWVIDPQDGIFYRYEDRQLTRRDNFSLIEKEISFGLSEIKKLVDKKKLIA